MTGAGVGEGATAVTGGGDPFGAMTILADAVMHEGQVLYPYRADALKNAYRWTFGVVGPRQWSAHRHAEPWWCQAGFVVKVTDEADLSLRCRWLQAVRRRRPGASADADWDEATPHHVDVRVPVAHLLDEPLVVPLLAPGSVTEGSDEHGPATRTARAVRGAAELKAQAHDGWAAVSVRIVNATPVDTEPPEDRRGHSAVSLLATHVMLAVDGTTVASVREPPPEAAAAVAATTGERLWTTLVDDTRALALPIVVPEPPVLAAATTGEVCDATEIEELLALRVQTLTPQEQADALRTDAVAAGVVSRLHALGADDLDLLHARVDPGGGRVEVAGQPIQRGSRVIVRPKRRADAMDRLLAGRPATVTGVFTDLDGGTHVTVTMDEDPAADLQAEMGRGFHFAPDELEPRGAQP